MWAHPRAGDRTPAANHRPDEMSTSRLRYNFAHKWLGRVLYALTPGFAALDRAVQTLFFSSWISTEKRLRRGSVGKTIL